MQRRLWTMFVVLLFLAIFASTVAAAPATENKSVTLISATFNNGTGIVLLFNTTGLTEKDLKNNSFFAHSNEYSLSCNFKDDSSVVRCVAPGGLSKYGGESFSGTLAGFAFWGTIPERKTEELTCSEGQSLWYTFSIYHLGELVFEEALPSEIYDFLVELIESNPEEFEGVTLQITGEFCGEEVIFEIPE